MNKRQRKKLIKKLQAAQVEVVITKRKFKPGDHAIIIGQTWGGLPIGTKVVIKGFRDTVLNNDAYYVDEPGEAWYFTHAEKDLQPIKEAN